MNEKIETKTTGEMYERRNLINYEEKQGRKTKIQKKKKERKKENVE